MKMYCPYCDREHEISIIEKKSEVDFKGEKIVFNEKNYYCDVCSVDFCDGELEDENLISIKDAYRKEHNLLTSNEIKNIREKYKLSQSDLALILGWGEVTITRYETKEIQNKNYDDVLRQISDNPYLLYDYFKMNMDSFNPKKQAKISKKIFSIVPDPIQTNILIEDMMNKKYFSINEETRGNQKLNINKIIAIINRVLNNCKELYKTKLAKLLWYIDMRNYQESKESMTGLAYYHMSYGACPLGLDLILDSKNITIEEIEIDDSVKYLIKGVESDYTLSEKELKVIDFVTDYFKDYSSSNIVEYMHKEKAYLETQGNEFISYKYAKDIHFGS